MSIATCTISLEIHVSLDYTFFNAFEPHLGKKCHFINKQCVVLMKAGAVSKITNMNLFLKGKKLLRAK